MAGPIEISLTSRSQVAATQQAPRSSRYEPTPGASEPTKTSAVVTAVAATLSIVTAEGASGDEVQDARRVARAPTCECANGYP